MNRLFIMALMPFTLAGCGATLPAIGGSVGVGTAVAVTSTGSTLSDIATLACEGQKAANAAGDLATSLGKTTAAAEAAKVSKALGLGCTWL